MKNCVTYSTYAIILSFIIVPKAVTAAIFMWTAPPSAWNQTVPGRSGARTVVIPVRNGTTDYPLRWNYTLLAGQDISLTFFAVDDGISHPQYIGYVENPGRVGEITTMSNGDDFQTRFRLQSDQESSTLIINKVNERENATFSLRIQVPSYQWVYNVRIEVTVPPSITHISGNQTVTEGQNVTLNCTADGNPTPNITWARLSDNSAVQIPLKNIRRQEKGEYRCTAHNGVGSPATRDTSIVVHYVPKDVVLNVSISGGKVCAGNMVQFICKAGTANPEVENYTLYQNGEVIANMIGSGVFTLWLNIRGLFMHRCVAENSIGTGASNNASVIVEGPFSVTSVSPRRVVKEGDNVTLLCNVTGDPAPVVSWVDARDEVRKNGGTWTLPKINRALKGEYSCVASNACGRCSKTTAINVQYPPTATDSGQNKTLRRGSSETLACPVDGNPEPRIVWYTEKEGGGTVLSTGNELKFLDAKSDDTGCYTCSASNSLGTPINITQCIVVVEPTSPVTSTPTTPRETTVVTWLITLTITNKDCNSFPEQEFRREVEKSLEHLGLNNIDIKTRCGSDNSNNFIDPLVADLVLGFNQSVGENDVISTLKDAAYDGKFGDFSVVSNSIKRTSSMSTSSPTPTGAGGAPECNCSCNTVLLVIIGILGAIIIVLIIIIVLQRKKGTATRFRSYKVPRGDAGPYCNELAMADVTPANVPPSRLENLDHLQSP